MPAYDQGRFAPPAPVAGVLIRNPETGKAESSVAMLIDSGADVTLLPAAIASAIELPGAPSRYELVAFDGTTSFARAVRAELVFLRRTFKGQFLLTGAEIGILGRDVLNHVSLVLDGPNRSWEEQPNDVRRT
jgi:hypothetical protein